MQRHRQRHGQRVLHRQLWRGVAVAGGVCPAFGRGKHAGVFVGNMVEVECFLCVKKRKGGVDNE